MGLVNMYPWTDFHDVNLSYILKLVRETQGLHLETAGNNLLMKSADGTVVSSIIVSFAQRAELAALATRANVADSATSAINANFATAAGSAATADSATNAAHAANADIANVATLANSATTAENANHAATADSATNAANAQRAAYAETTGSVEHATNAIETITINGNAVRFTTYGGQNIDITIPYAVKAFKDVSNHEFTKAYVCNVVENTETGALDFKNMEGNTIVSLTPSTTQAATDNYGNNIAEYIKAILVNSGSNFLTINHGDGTSETITIPYSVTAWKDSNGNIIKNSYVKRLEVVVDPNDGKRKLVAYNGDNPEAEIFRIELNCYSAQIADNATHAVNADHAATADEATTAQTSTGSVSSITRNRTTLTITNGDGTTSTIDLFRNSQRYLWVKQSINNNTELLDPAFTVGHSEEFGVDNYNTVWGYKTAFQAMAEGAKIDYINANSYGLFSSFAQKGFALDNGDPYSSYQIFVFDTIAGALKCFEITPPADEELTPGNITITRLM